VLYEPYLSAALHYLGIVSALVLFQYPPSLPAAAQGPDIYQPQTMRPQIFLHILTDEEIKPKPKT